MTGRLDQLNQSSLVMPGGGIVLAVSGVFLLLGIGLCAVGIYGDPVAFAIGGPFCLFAITGIVSHFLSDRNLAVQYHDDSLAPEVPETPLLEAGVPTMSGRSHRLIQQGYGGRLEPDPKAPKRRIWTVGAFTAILMASMMTVIFALRPLDSAVGNVAIALFILFCGSMATGIVVWLTNRSMNRRSLFWWDRDGWELKIGNELIATGERSVLVAVQLCAACDKVGTRENHSLTDALELNLAWREGDELARKTLLRTRDSIKFVAECATDLSYELQIPLLFHATASHWNDEMARAKRRRPRFASLS